jgi:hypothetical protein
MHCYGSLTSSYTLVLWEHLPYQAYNWMQTSSHWTSEEKSSYFNTSQNWNSFLITQSTIEFSSPIILFCSRQCSLSFQLFESEWWSCGWILWSNLSALMNSRYHLCFLSSSKPSEFVYALCWNLKYPQFLQSRRLRDTFRFRRFLDNLYRCVECCRCSRQCGPNLLDKCLPNNSSAFSAEAHGILLVLCISNPVHLHAMHCACTSHSHNFPLCHGLSI